jgi:hypothetical protein
MPYEPPCCEAWAVTGRSRSSLITLTLPLVDARMLTVVHTVEPRISSSSETRVGLSSQSSSRIQYFGVPTTWCHCTCSYVHHAQLAPQPQLVGNFKS